MNQKKIIKDPKYGFLRLEKIPSQDEVERFYLEDFYSGEYKSFNDSSLEIQAEEKEFFDSRWERISDFCKGHFGRLKGLSVFDIGFGFGQALIYFDKLGMKTSGLEPSKEGVDYMKSKGFDVYQSGIEDFSCVGTRRFDVVTLINVLEHLRDPAKTLLNIREKLLEKDGVLIIDVPNEFNDFQTVANAEYGLGEWWVCPPNHINYFSGSSLSILLKKCGYEIVDKSASFPLEMFLLMGDVYVGDNKLGKICHNKRVRFEHLMRKHGKMEKLNAFYKDLAELDLGRQVVVFCRTGRE